VRSAPSGYVSARTSSPLWTPSRRQRLIPRPSSPERGRTGPGCEGASPGPAPHRDRPLVSDRYTIERSRPACPVRPK
jgi:hypothetical protein